MAMGAQTPQERGEAEEGITRALRQLFAVVEAYPAYEPMRIFRACRKNFLRPKIKLLMLANSITIRFINIIP